MQQSAGGGRQGGLQPRADQEADGRGEGLPGEIPQGEPRAPGGGPGAAFHGRRGRRAGTAEAGAGQARQGQGGAGQGLRGGPLDARHRGAAGLPRRLQSFQGPLQGLAQQGAQGGPRSTRTRQGRTAALPGGQGRGGRDGDRPGRGPLQAGDAEVLYLRDLPRSQGRHAEQAAGGCLEGVRRDLPGLPRPAGGRLGAHLAGQVRGGPGPPGQRAGDLRGGAGQRARPGRRQHRSGHDVLPGGDVLPAAVAEDGAEGVLPGGQGVARRGRQNDRSARARRTRPGSRFPSIGASIWTWQRSSSPRLRRRPATSRGGCSAK